jgi:ParB family chromosome partitioning protein
MERRLGRGLNALLGQTTAVEEQTTPTELPIGALRANPYQPRATFEPQSLAELGESIREHGILQPIVVRRAPTGYEIISGERRWRAAQAIGLLTVPVVVRGAVADEQMLELALIENVQRQDLDAMERARGFEQMVKQLGLTQDEVARKVGLQRATVANHLRLLELPVQVQEAVARGVISMGHARALLAHPEPTALPSMLKRIAHEDLSVRQVEQIVRAAVERSGERPRAKPKTDSRPPWVGELESTLRESLGTRVVVKNEPGYRGEIVIEYYDRGELERLCRHLAPPRSL